MKWYKRTKIETISLIQKLPVVLHLYETCRCRSSKFFWSRSSYPVKSFYNLTRIYKTRPLKDEFLDEYHQNSSFKGPVLLNVSILKSRNWWGTYQGNIFSEKFIQCIFLWKFLISVWMHTSEAITSYESFQAQNLHFVPFEDKFSKTRLVKENILCLLRTI